jgi:hypothetical protein
MRLLGRRKPRPRLLGVLLCYNDGDLVGEAVAYLREQGHDVVAWDHGSTDHTPDVLQGLRGELLELTTIPRSFDFYQLYPRMSRHLLDTYVDRYDWVSWPDQDEFLEGPDRSRPYRDWILEVLDSPYDWVRFANYNFWWTAEDDPSVKSPVARVRHYAIWPDCAPRIRAWRARSTNERQFNHNDPLGTQYPTWFNLRHYPMRDEAQMRRRLDVDRANLERAGSNFHYENMKAWQERLFISADQLHVDDGGELDPAPVFDWRTVYGYADSRDVSS